jgi:hypothetical protein
MSDGPTATLFKNPAKYRDWSAWFTGLWSTTAVAGAAAVTSMLTTNGVEATLSGVPGLGDAVKGLGMGWKTMIAQFIVHVILAQAKYISDTKGLPPDQNT